MSHFFGSRLFRCPKNFQKKIKYNINKKKLGTKKYFEEISAKFTFNIGYIVKNPPGYLGFLFFRFVF